MYSVLILYYGSFKDMSFKKMRSRETRDFTSDISRQAIFEEIIAKNFPKPTINTSQFQEVL